ncbi:MAG: tRNA-(ms[2]io[6]A)-hydroxylase [Deltaproteobacteria bacterium]|nr:MAG: tRNA-(ms[2]io[6]A)-hydroxylase [Deltaproteobacteria bacterium]
MLGLLKPTDPAWVDAVKGNLEALLIDHAHCELKAAQSALSIVSRHGWDHPELAEPLLELAREETEHFRDVLKEARERGIRVPPPEPDKYVSALMKEAKRDGTPERRLLDRLLVSALIEARSCERFQLLAEGLDDPDLAAFYDRLMQSEARHYRLFTSLAEAIWGEEITRERFSVLAAREATVVDRLALGPTVHG